MSYEVTSKKLHWRCQVSVLKLLFSVVISEYPNTLMEQLCNDSNFFRVIAERHFGPIDRRVSVVDVHIGWIAGLELEKHGLEAVDKVFEQEYVVCHRICSAVPWIRRLDWCS